MTVQPGHEGAGAGGGHLRASDADREQVIGVLKAAFAQGRLAKDELDVRVGQVLASRTYADLDALTSDLPRGLDAQPPWPAPARIKAPVNANVRPRDRAIIAPAILAGLALVAAVLLTGSPVAGPLVAGAAGSTFVSLFLLAVQIRGARRDQRPGGQPPPNRTLDTGPGADHQAAPATEQRPRPKPRRQRTTDAARTRLARPQAVVPCRA
jgi:hypothetical protein